MYSISVRREIRFRAPALRVKYVDWYVSRASYSDANGLNTPTFPMYDDITLYYYSGFARPVVVLRTCIMVHCTLLVCVTHGLNAATVTPQRKKASMCPRVSKSDSGVLHGQKKAKFLHRSWVVICQNFFHFGFEAKIDVYPSRNPRHVETRQTNILAELNHQAPN